MPNRYLTSTILLLTAQLGFWMMPLEIASANSNRPNYSSAWGNFLSWFQRKKPPFGGRGGDCIISPVYDRNGVPVWNDRPSLVWTGQTGQIKLIQNAQSLGAQKVEKLQENYQARHSSKPLSFGEVYEWKLFTIAKQSRLFRLVEPPQRNQVTTDLQKLQAQLKAERATPESIALRRAEVFQQYDLASDALQELFSVQNPSPELKKLKQDVVTEFCSARKPTPTAR